MPRDAVTSASIFDWDEWPPEVTEEIVVLARLARKRVPLLQESVRIDRALKRWGMSASSLSSPASRDKLLAWKEFVEQLLERAFYSSKLPSMSGVVWLEDDDG